METDKEIKHLIDDYFGSSEYKVIDFLFRGEGGTKVLEIFVDNEKGVNIDELARINRDLNELVDSRFSVHDISKLVVSSPGVENPVKFLWQLIKHTGRTLEIEMNNGEMTEGKLININIETGKISVEIMHREKKKDERIETKELNFSDIKKLTVKINFSKK